jgi:very-short-patch-repair endonuclease
MQRTAEETMAFLQAQAQRMRTWPTKAERKLWEILEPLGFQRQWPIYAAGPSSRPYILDFYHPELLLAVEVDGPSHTRRREHDRRRDRRLALAGIRTVRFANREVETDLEGMRRRLEDEIARQGSSMRSV